MVLVILISTMLVAGMAGCRPDQQMAPDTQEERYANYAGSEACAGCHSSIYSKFVESGHPFILSEVVNGVKPIFPFTRLPNIPAEGGLTDCDNSLGAPRGYGDLSYVIGGFKWKAHFIDLNGFIITGTNTQYNMDTGRWTAYNNDVRDKPYDCGSCHTTGWKPFSEGHRKQGDLAGMMGTFFSGGVQCEACHGAGAAHVNSSGKKEYISRDESSKLCGKCHTRESQNRIAASGGFIQHHGQYDELLGIDPDNVASGGMGGHLKKDVGCNTCHDPHASTVFADRANASGLRVNCTTCHRDREIASGPHSMANLANSGLLKPQGRAISNCVICHMPKLTKSAVSTAATGSGPVVGDIKTHIFKIDLSKTQQFTADGKYSYPWLTGKYACKQCHNGVDFFSLNFPSTYKIHK